MVRKDLQFWMKKGYFDLHENLFQNISISAQYCLGKRGSNYPVFICWHWMIFIFHLFWFKNKFTVYNVYTSHLALKVKPKSSLNLVKLDTIIKTVFTSWESWKSLKLHGFLLQKWGKRKKKREEFVEFKWKKLGFPHCFFYWWTGMMQEGNQSPHPSPACFGDLDDSYIRKTENPTLVLCHRLLSFSPIQIVSLFYKINRTDLLGFAWTLLGAASLHQGVFLFLGLTNFKQPEDAIAFVRWNLPNPPVKNPHISWHVSSLCSFLLLCFSLCSLLNRKTLPLSTFPTFQSLATAEVVSLLCCTKILIRVMPLCLWWMRKVGWCYWESFNFPAQANTPLTFPTEQEQVLCCTTGRQIILMQFISNLLIQSLNLGA